MQQQQVVSPYLSVEDVEAIHVSHVLEGVGQPPAHPDRRRRHPGGRGYPRTAGQRIPPAAREALSRHANLRGRRGFKPRFGHSGADVVHGEADELHVDLIWEDKCQYISPI